jgi:hypothetical protein
VYANVLMMLIAPVSDVTPAACSDTIKTHTHTCMASGGYTTHAEPMIVSHGASSSA